MAVIEMYYKLLNKKLTFNLYLFGTKLLSKTLPLADFNLNSKI